jgi:purine-binding chemotaxis protein CheW
MSGSDPTEKRGEERAADWAALHERLANARAAVDTRSGEAGDRRRQMLTERTRLAEAAPSPAVPAGQIEVLEFSIMRETYAVESSFVRDVIKLHDFVALPGTPAFVLGITAFDDKILSILDLRRFFKLPELGLSDMNRVIVLSRPGMQFGVLADSVRPALALAPTQMLPLPATLSGIRAAFCRAVTAEGVMLLDAGKLLGEEQLIVRESDASPPSGQRL